jgi:hypothetical protein
LGSVWREAYLGAELSAEAADDPIGVFRFLRQGIALVGVHWLAACASAEGVWRPTIAGA